MLDKNRNHMGELLRSYHILRDTEADKKKALPKQIFQTMDSKNNGSNILKNELLENNLQFQIKHPNVRFSPNARKVNLQTKKMKDDLKNGSQREIL